jgi:Ca2+-binding EF-hand superfamily protein
MTRKSDLEMTRDEKILMEEIQNMQKKITYGDLFNILLDYHIRTRSKYLKNFKNLFKKFDNNNDGILTKKELIQLIRELNIFDENEINQNIDLLLRKLPFCEKYNSFSFSEVLALFDEEKLTNKNGDIISILDAIAK